MNKKLDATQLNVRISLASKFSSIKQSSNNNNNNNNNNINMCWSKVLKSDFTHLHNAFVSKEEGPHQPNCSIFNILLSVK